MLNQSSLEQSIAEMKVYLKSIGVPVIFGQIISKKKLSDPRAVSAAEKTL